MTRLDNLDLPNRFFYVDAFTSSEDASLLGNPAGVIVTAEPLSDLQAESIAKKLALPAIAILSDPDLFASATLPEDAVLPIAYLGPEGHWIPLCGHATMAASSVLLQLFPQTNSLTFRLRSGRVFPVRRTKKGAEMGMPALPSTKPLELVTRQAALETLYNFGGLKEEDVVELRQAANGQHTNLFVELAPSVDLKNLPVKPDALLEMPCFGLWVIKGDTSDGEADFNTRVFFPKIGIPEDQVCGAAHTAFGPYWLSKTASKGAKGDDKVSDEVKIVSKQVSPKGGRLGVRWNGVFGEEEGVCWLEGEAVVIDKGSLPSVGA